MKNLFKGKIATVGIIIATLILAGVAVFTAIRLYQLRQEAVAPTAPTSKPKAQEVPKACTALTFELGTPTSVVCNKKGAFKDDSKNATGAYYLTGNDLDSGTTVVPGQKIVFAIFPGPKDILKPITIVDTIPDGLTFVDSDSVCTYNSTNRKVTCSLNGTNTQAAFRVTVNTDASGSITNQALVTGEGDQESICSVGINVSTTPSPSGNLNTCNGTCGSNSNCETGLFCYQGYCRNTSCPNETDCTCQGEPNSCNGTCGSNYNCKFDLFCYSGYCRNSSCPAETDCSCTSTTTPTPTPKLTTATPTPTEPSLPDAGVSVPTIFGIGLGTLLLIGAILLAL